MRLDHLLSREQAEGKPEASSRGRCHDERDRIEREGTKVMDKESIRKDAALERVSVTEGNEKR